MRAAVVVLSMLAMTQITGCFTSTRYIDLPYPSKSQLEESSTATHALAPLERSIRVDLVVEDLRETRDRIGNTKLWKEHFLTDNNVEVWVYDAIRLELGQLGYRMSDLPQTLADGSTDRLMASVRKVYCDIYEIDLYRHVACEVTLQATLERAGKEPLTMEFPAQARSNGSSLVRNWTFVGELLAQALQSATRDMLNKFGFAN